MSKRRLLRLVNEHHVEGWDDPRLLTLDGLRRRGYTAESIRDFCEMIGISRTETMIPMQKLEHCIRARMENTGVRAMVVLQPVKCILTNWPDNEVETVKAPRFPKDESRGFRDIPISKVVYLERSDIRLNDSKDFYGLATNKTVHLKYAYHITANRIECSADGQISTVYATIDKTNTGKVKGNLHWVAEPTPGVMPLNITCRLYENLFQSRVCISYFTCKCLFAVLTRSSLFV